MWNWGAVNAFVIFLPQLAPDQVWLVDQDRFPFVASVHFSRPNGFFHLLIVDLSNVAVDENICMAVSLDYSVPDRKEKKKNKVKNS